MRVYQNTLGPGIIAARKSATQRAKKRATQSEAPTVELLQ